MPSWEDELAELGGGPSWEDELAELGGDMPQVGVTLEGLDAEAAASGNPDDVYAAREGFKPWTQPGDAGSSTQTSGSFSAGTPQWGLGEDADPLDSLLESTSDFGQRAAMGATMGWGDELVGAFSPERGQAIRDRQELAQERSPDASLAGDIFGAGAMGVATGGLASGATRGLGFAGKLAAGAGLGGEQAAVSAAGYADDGYGMEAATDPTQVVPGMAFGAGGEMVGSGLEAAGDWAQNTAAPWMREQGLFNRVASTGLHGGSMERQAANLGGKKGVAELGQWMEDNGLTQLTPGGIGDEAASLNSMWRGDQANFIDELGELPDGMPMVNTRPITQGLRDEGARYAPLPDSDSQSLAGMYNKQADNITNATIPPLDEALERGTPVQRTPVPRTADWMPYDETVTPLPSDELSFDKAWRARQGYDNAVNYNKLGGPREDALYEGVARDAANGLRGGLTTALEETAPQLAPRWEGIQNNLSKSQKIMSAGQGTEMRDLGGNVAPTGGLRAMAGAAGGGLPGWAAATAAEYGGRSMLATAEKGGAAALDWLGSQAPISATGARAAGQAGAQQFQQAQDQTRGYLLPDAAFQLMQQPGALGPYEAQFWEAYKSPDSHATTTLISKLSNTDKRFAAEYLPKLRALTAENR